MVLALAACTTAPPPLPADTTSVNREYDLAARDFTTEDLARSCAAIDEERQNNADAIRRAESVIVAHRGRNQAAAYVGTVLFLPALALIAPDATERDVIVTLRKRQDTLIQLGAFRKC